MVENTPEAAGSEVEFEASELIEYGDATELTRGAHSSSRQADGNYTS